MLGTSKEEFERLLPLFEQTLLEIKLSNPKKKKKIGQGIKGKLPTTEHKLFFTLFYLEEMFERFPEIKDVFIDGVERKIQRPKNKKKQNRVYPGKKKIHAKKNNIVTDAKKKIIFLTPIKSARRHDKRLADKVSLFEHIPESIAVWLDTGFQGVLKQHRNTLIPKKATKGKPLTCNEKEENRIISSLRVRVEHAIAGIKNLSKIFYAVPKSDILQ